MITAIKSPSQKIHELYRDGYIETEDFLQQIEFLYRNVPNKNKYYIKMMNKYEYIDGPTTNKMIRLDRLITRPYADWYLHCDRKNKYASQKPDVIDFYHSLNLYGNKKEEGSNRKIAMDSENIEMLVGLMIDIDITESIFSSLDTYQIYQFLVEEDILGNTVPFPNAIVYSGAGIHLLIKFKYPAKATEKTKTLVNNMQECFRKELQEQLVIKEKSKYKTDTLSLTTSTRINTSFNSKNFEKVKFVIISEEFQELSELQAIFDKIKPYSKKKNQPQNITHLGLSKKTPNPQKAYIMLQDRKNDLKKLQAQYPDECKGNEEKLCFLYCNFTVQQYIHTYIGKELKDEEINFEEIKLTKEMKKEFFNLAFEEVVEYNNGFSKPYKPRQMRSKMNVLTKKTYRFRTKKIIEWLNLNEDIQWNLKTIAVPEVIKARKEAKYKKKLENLKAERRNENGLTKREQDKLDLTELVQRLKKQGLTQKEVAEKVKKSERTVKRYWNV